MSRATLTFTLPEERDDLNLAFHGLDWALVAEDMDTKLRNLLKHGGHGYDDHTLEYVRDTLHEILDDHAVSFDMIT